MDPSEDELGDLTNVSHRFQVLFVLGLVINFIQVIASVMSCFASNAARAFNAATQVVMFIVSGVYLAMVTSARLSHSGEVCSGDFLLVPVSLETRKTGVLGVEGQCFAIYMITGFIQLFVIIIYSVIVCCAKEGKYSPDKERDM